MHNWKYNGKEITSLEQIEEILGEEPFGFVYKVELPGEFKYIGKKQLRSYLNKKLGKKELAILKEERKNQGMRGKTPTTKHVVKESNWIKYCGSHEYIKEKVKNNQVDNLERTILEFAWDKKHLTYLECKYQYSLGVLEGTDVWLNDNIQGKIFTRDICIYYSDKKSF